MPDCPLTIFCFGRNKSPELFPDYWRDLYRKLAPFLNIISNDPAIVSTQEGLKQVKESKDFIATNLATQNKMLESQLREMKTSNEKKINAMAEAIGLLTGWSVSSSAYRC
jgi:hypothetical protein